MTEADSDLERATRAGKLLFGVASVLFLALGLLALFLSWPEFPLGALMLVATGLILGVIAVVAPKRLMAGVAT
jgi:hypothetical protein